MAPFTIIRPAEEKDLDKIIEMMIQIAAHENADFDPYDKKERYNNMLFGEVPRFCCLVAEGAGIVCGCATYSKELSVFAAEDYLRLNSLYIMPDYRNRGIGKKMINALFEVAMDKGYNSMQCYTPAMNTGAINFYLDMGAKTKNAVRFYFTDLRQQS